jgi:hypothetical protein
MNGYWKCEFGGKNNETVLKTIYAKTSEGAFRHTYEMGVRLGLEPKYETLRMATDEEAKEFKRMIKNRVKK